jgi:hypothetical protein
MDFRDTSIMTQVGFKGAIDLCRDIDLTTQEGQAEFIQVFSFLTDALFEAVRQGADPAEQAAEIIRGNFPGTTTVQSNPGQQSYAAPPAYVQPTQQPGPMQFSLSVKGTQHGPLPDWLFAEAAAKGVTEVYDNRDRAQGTKRPHSRSTTGGDNAPAFWPPR